MNYAFTLPLPPSTNNIYVDRPGGGRFMSAAGNAYKKLALETLPKIPASMTGPIVVIYEYWFPNQIRRDIANYEKVITDVLVEGGVMLDDSQIVQITLIKRTNDKENPRMCGVVRQLENEEQLPAQAALAL